MTSTPTYIVTGATRGIGRAVAVALVERGFRVIAVGRSLDLLSSLSEACGSLLMPVSGDITTDAVIEKVVGSVASESELHGVVHAAGSLIPLVPYDKIDSDELTQHFRVHVGAPIALHNSLTKAHSVKRMLFIDSYSASTPRHEWGAYSTVKAAAQMAARCAAQELTETRTIRVYPGAVNTQIVDSVLASDTETASTFASMVKKGELAEPFEVAEFLVALLVDASDELLCSRDVFDYNNEADRRDALRCK